MNSKYQKTISQKIEFEGIGLHLGRINKLSILPAIENTGYIFKRVDISENNEIKALFSNVISTERSTSIGNGNCEVHTIEHLLAALYGCGIDNAIIEIDGDEVPILDGSAEPFVNKIIEVGFVVQKEEREYFELKENLKFEIVEKGIEYLAVPDDKYRLTVMVDYNSPVLGTQHAQMLNIDEFIKEIAPCRTFVFFKELEYLAKNNLIKGGNIDNAIVLIERDDISQEELDNLKKLLGKEHLDIKIDKKGVLNNIELKFQNETARHKLLDIVGDFALLGKRIKAHILGARTGHYGNAMFVKELYNVMQKQNSSKTYDLTKPPVFDINDISKKLPHAYPFLLIDKILELTDNTIVGLKNVTFNEPYFQGHFPNNPVMPGVLQVEAMAQCGGVFALCQVEDPENYSTYFMKIDNVKYKQKVIPGDTIIFELKLKSPIRRGLVEMSGEAYVNGKLVSQADMLAQVKRDKI